MKLYQESRKGKMKWIDVYTEGDTMVSKWGLEDSDKIQEVKKVCKPTNVGKENERNAEQQAVFEAEAKIVKKKKEGYRLLEELEEFLSSEEEVFTLSKLPEEFCPCKPISKCPQKIKDDPNTYGQRKRNGHCLILVHDEEGGKAVYSRRMEKLPAVLLTFKEIAAVMDLVPKGSMVLCEMCFVDNKGKEDTRRVAKLVRTKKEDKIKAAYEENCELGMYECIPFDALYFEGEFIGTRVHAIRYGILQARGFMLPAIIHNWKDKYEEAKAAGWEGFILRTTDERSYISFSMDGKAYREGSWKEKFVFEDDVVVVGATMGKSGRHAGVYARFDLRQYNDAGELVHYGYCGTGILKHDELKEMTADIDNGKLKFPFVIEIEFASRHYDSHAFEFPIFQRIRYDKTPEECVFNPE